MLGNTLSVVIPVVVIAYGVWLAVRMIRRRKSGGGCTGCGGCAGCPYAGSCHSEADCKLPKGGPKHE